MKNYENMDIRLSINGIKGSILIINDEGSWVDEDLQLLVVVLIADTTAELIIESDYHPEGWWYSFLELYANQELIFAIFDVFNS